MTDWNARLVERKTAAALSAHIAPLVTEFDRF